MSASASPASPSDRALARAMVAWGVAPSGGGEAVWSRFAPGWRARIGAAWDEASARMGPDEAKDLLRADLAAMTRPDPGRIHSSWWARAAQEESPAVRRAVAAFGPPRMAEAVRATLAGEAGIEPSRTPDAAAVRWAVCLFAERLIGGVTRDESDPPVVTAVSAGHGAELLRLARSTALAKLAYAEAGVVERRAGPELPPLSSRERDRFDHFVGAWRRLGTDTRLVRVALWDADDRSDSTVGRTRSARSELSRLGLTTIGRLMAAVEPQRVRWALQHLPYPIARVLRSRMNLKNPLVAGRGLGLWEESLWRLATQRLEAERRGAAP